MRKLTLIITLLALGHMTSHGMWSGHAIPGAFNKQNNQWSILFAKDARTNNWSDFKGAPGSAYEGLNTAATRALAQQTNNIYNIDPQALYNTVIFQDKPNYSTYYFVEVPFVSGSVLYNKARNNTKDDFMWVPEDELFSSAPIINKFTNQPVAIDPMVLNVARYFVQQLKQAPKKEYTSWNDIPNAVYFYDKDKPYYEFTNFAEGYPITMNNKIWPTTEQYFQAQKFPNDPAIQEQIRNLTSTPGGASAGRKAFSIAQKNKDKVRPDWFNVSLSIMLDAVRAKFTQNNQLKNMLLATGNRILVEDARGNDAFWGNGADGKGENHLGQMLMRVREELQGQTQPSAPYVSNGPSYYAQRYGQ